MIGLLIRHGHADAVSPPAVEIDPAHVSAIGITSEVRRVLGVDVPASMVAV